MISTEVLSTGAPVIARAPRRASAPMPRVLAVLAIALLALLPFTAVDLMTSVMGDLGVNLALPVILALFPIALARMAPFPLTADAGGRYEALVRTVFWFFVWCAFDTILTGLIFEPQTIDAYGWSPAAHSLTRFAAPLVLAALVVVSYQIGLRILRTDQIDRVLWLGAVGLAAYGAVQVYALIASPSWYFSLAGWMEAARNRPGPWQPEFVSYIHLTGRLNLTAFEAAEAARLIVILYLPSLLTSGGRGRLSRRILAVILIGIVLAAQTIVGLACLCCLGALGLLVNRTRLRSLLWAGAAVAVFAALLAIPNPFADRLFSLVAARHPGEIDDSVLTRAASLVASLRVTLTHPLLGIGWSKEIFFVPNAMPDWGHSPEITYSLATGQALGAKSMAARLLLYSGIPAFSLAALMFVRTFAEALRHYRRTRDPRFLRLVLVIAMFIVGGTLDGGILMTAYPWTALGMALGLAARASLEPAVARQERG